MRDISKGLWTISKGKGDRFYVNVDGEYAGQCSGVMHPEEIAETNGLGVYGLIHLIYLRDAINAFISQPSSDE